MAVRPLGRVPRYISFSIVFAGIGVMHPPNEIDATTATMTTATNSVVPRRNARSMTVL